MHSTSTLINIWYSVFRSTPFHTAQETLLRICFFRSGRVLRTWLYGRIGARTDVIIIISFASAEFPPLFSLSFFAPKNDEGSSTKILPHSATFLCWSLQKGSRSSHRGCQNRATLSHGSKNVGKRIIRVTGGGIRHAIVLLEPKRITLWRHLFHFAPWSPLTPCHMYWY